MTHFPRTRNTIKDPLTVQTLTETARKARQHFTRKGVELPPADRIRFVPVDLPRGRAKSIAEDDGDRYYLVTIPSWAFTHADYLPYYVMHELCHVAVVHSGNHDDHHGPEFYQVFGQAVPRKYHKHEQEYMPRNYVQFGPG